MELFLYLIFLDLDKIDVYRDKTLSSNQALSFLEQKTGRAPIRVPSY